MNRADELRLERYLNTLDALSVWRNEAEMPVGTWRFVSSDSKVVDLRLGDLWPVPDFPNESGAEFARLSAEVRVPEEWAGRELELELWLGGEGFVKVSSGGETTRGGLNPFHRRFRVQGHARGGEGISVEVEAVPRGLFGSRIAEPRIEHARLVVPDAEMRALLHDISTVCEVCVEIPDHDVVPHLLDAVDLVLSRFVAALSTGNDANLTRLISVYDDPFGSGLSSLPDDIAAQVPGASRRRDALWSLPRSDGPAFVLSEETRREISTARRELSSALDGMKDEYPPTGRVALTGHAHLDLAWLWPLAETRRKARRTFATVLGLMDRYEDFVFDQSSAQLYAWLEEDDPAMFERVRRRIEEGRWEAVGGSWTEPDCQMPGGEAYVRQLLYGQRYFESRFGKRSSVAWLPDAFGFSPSLPQLFWGAGIEGFFTAKLSWSETNKFPHDLFIWEGIDGSRVRAHTFRNPGMDYNGDVSARDIIGVWKNFEGKRRHPETLFSVGWGDGGGGPSEEMLESYARLKDFPASPRLRMSRIDDFFASLPDDGLPKWVGELYLELHRGTLTSQAKVKRLNRVAEHRLVEAEVFRELARTLGLEPPETDLPEAWRMLLLNQFHDILPGSSIAEVYVEAHAQLERVCEVAVAARDEALAVISSRVGSPEGTDTNARTMLVGNALLHPRPLSLVLPEGKVATDLNGRELLVQRIEGGTLVHDPDFEVPATGYATIVVRNGEPGSPPPESVSVSSTGNSVVIENGVLRVTVGPDGSLHGVYDLAASREVLDGRGNQLHAYVDRPREWDAWDVDANYESWGEEVGGVTSVEVVESGPLRAGIRVVREWRDSRIAQTYRLHAKSRRLDIETKVDWEERQVLLRTLFPLKVRSHEATFETMFGTVRRPTHRNTSWDEARFEVCAHRFADLSEPGYGVALLNDGKYGHSAHGNTLGLSLLRSPTYPDLLADRGSHEFMYSLYPHVGDWTEAGVAREAAALNSPLFLAEVSGEGPLPDEVSLVEASGVEVFIGTVKAPEDGGEGVIVRLYEPHGARGECVLKFPRVVDSVARTNLLEEPDTSKSEPTLVDANTVRLEVGPFEVVTLRVSFGPDGRAYREAEMR